LLLNAAVPMLASIAAQAQGKQVGEICSLHGVPSSELRNAVSPHDDTGNAGDASTKHCPLAALAMLAAPTFAVVSTTASISADLPAWSRRGATPHDAQAAWAARLKHDPPARS
jgi:hypothetical protein